MKNDNFKNWLIEQKQFTPRSAKDVASRVQRVLNFQPFKLTSSSEAVIKKMKETEQFKSFSVSVRSQLKRSIRLFFEFNKFKAK